MIENKLNLQLFAEGGTLVNATATFENAYDASKSATRGNQASGEYMAAELKEFYDTELLENARIEMYYAQFAKKQNLPKGNGKTVEFRKWNTFANATALQEAVIPTGQKFGMTTLNGSVAQYGTYTAISDQLELQAYDNVILGATEEMGASAAQTQETLIRDALLTGGNVIYCDTLDATGAYKATPTSCAGLYHSSANGYSYVTPDMVAKAVTKLKKDRVPTIGGKYVCVIHPSCVYDLRKNEDWVSVHQYAHPEEIFNGEIGELHGVRFVENPFAPVMKTTDYTSGDSGCVYATYFFGKDAFAIIEPADGLEMIIHDKSEIGGPLNQFSTIGYKFSTNGATILYPERVLRMMSASSFSASDTAN